MIAKWSHIGISPGRVCANTDIYDRPNQFKNTDLEPAPEAKI